MTRDSPFYPLSDAYAHPVPDPPPPIIVGGETAAGARLAGRIGDGWTAFDDNFEAQPAALPRVARGERPATRGPARHRRLPGRLAERRVDRRLAVGDGPARDLGALARGRRRRRDRPGPDDGRRRRARRGHRPLVGAAERSPRRRAAGRFRGTIRLVTAPDTVPPPAAAPSARARPNGTDPRAASAAAHPCRSTSACASAATRSGCGTRPARRSTASPSPASSRSSSSSRSLGRFASRGSDRSTATWSTAVPDGDRPGDHPDRDQPGHERRADDVPRDGSAGPDRQPRRVRAQPGSSPVRPSRSPRHVTELGDTVVDR